jgi:Protein of unknown function (DUF2997)
MDGPYEEIRINEDGTFESVIHGVKGPSCAKLQEKWKAMGRVTSERKTAEFHEKPAQAVQKQHVRSS